MASRRSYSPERASVELQRVHLRRGASRRRRRRRRRAPRRPRTRRGAAAPAYRGPSSPPRATRPPARAASARRRITFCASLGSSQKPGWPDCRSSCWISSSSLGMSKTVEDVLNALLKLFQCGLCLLHGCTYLQLRLYRSGRPAPRRPHRRHGGRPTAAAPSRAGPPGGWAPAAGSRARGAAPSRRRARSRCGGRAIRRAGGRRSRVRRTAPMSSPPSRRSAREPAAAAGSSCSPVRRDLASRWSAGPGGGRGGRRCRSGAGGRSPGRRRGGGRGLRSSFSKAWRRTGSSRKARRPGT